VLVPFCDHQRSAFAKVSLGVSALPNLHPLVVHFPIALFVTAVICELLAYFRKSRLLGNTALLTTCVATSGAIFAVITGLLAKSIVPASGEAQMALESHETLGYLVLASSLAFTALKGASYLLKTDRLLTAQLLVGFAGVVITFMAANEGGELVYRHGVGMNSYGSNKHIVVDTIPTIKE
jgi:uncharacterized membrane protein